MVTPSPILGSVWQCATKLALERNLSFFHKCGVGAAQPLSRMVDDGQRRRGSFTVLLQKELTYFAKMYYFYQCCALKKYEISLIV